MRFASMLGAAFIGLVVNGTNAAQGQVTYGHSTGYAVAPYAQGTPVTVPRTVTYHPAPASYAASPQRSTYSYSQAPVQSCGTLVPSPVYGRTTASPSLPSQAAYYSPVAQPTLTAWQTPGYQAYRPVAQVTPSTNQAYLGLGLLGQPKAYVSGQPVRNLFRYLLP